MKTKNSNKEYIKEWQKNNRDKLKKNSRTYYERNKEKVLAMQKLKNQKDPYKRYLTNLKSDLKKRGVTVDEYYTMLKKQKGLCAICKKQESSSPGKKSKWTNTQRLSVDHCHKTKKVRGLLCSNCNRGIGYLKDDIKILSKAISYLKNNI